MSDILTSHGFKILLGFLVILSTYIIGKKNKWGWVLGAMASIGWVYNNAIIGEYELALTTAIMLGIKINAGIKWFRGEQ